MPAHHPGFVADRITFLNPGGLPPPLRPEDLKRPHPSKPRNRKIAEALFAVLHVKASGRLTNAEYQRLFQVSKRTASDDLADLERRGVVQAVAETTAGS
ncbi:MAG: hypothetical protein HY690_17745 [Chloroflexi bacterium]|nr:hypothetical protein [Chloroflexota bacterium]